MQATQVTSVIRTAEGTSRCSVTSLFILNALRKRRHSSTSQRKLHLSSAKDVSLSFQPIACDPVTSLDITTRPIDQDGHLSPLSTLPINQLLRTYLITTVSSSPTLLGLSTSLLRRTLTSANPLFNISRNPGLRALLKATFYKQFCAGASPTEVAATCNTLRQQGYAGVILEYALEVLNDSSSTSNKAAETHDIATWRTGMLSSISMAMPGDFVGLKWSGMGQAAVQRMKHELPPSEAMLGAMCALADAAAAKGIALLPAAEETWSLKGFHEWTLMMQKRYNKVGGRSVVYNTYQAYLRQTPGTLAEHLDRAVREDFVLGVKLVRGAYLGSERRDLIWSNIEQTHAAYDGLAEGLIRRAYNRILTPTSGTETSLNTMFPPVNVVLATHNVASVSKAQTLRREQASRGEALTTLVFAQLQGMADEVSCALVAESKTLDVTHSDAASGGVNPGSTDSVPTAAPFEKVYKCTTWGSLYECLNYLLRRAAENRDAAGRTVGTRKAMGTEILRRLKVSLGLM